MKLHAITHLPDDLPRGPLPKSRRQLEEDAAAAEKRNAPPPGPPPVTSAPPGYRITPEGGIELIGGPQRPAAVSVPTLQELSDAFQSAAHRGATALQRWGLLESLVVNAAELGLAGFPAEHRAEAIRRLKQVYSLEKELPDGIHEVRDGAYEARCCCCERWTPLFCDLSEVPAEGYEHYCGGSDRCCP